MSDQTPSVPDPNVTQLRDEPPTDAPSAQPRSSDLDQPPPAPSAQEARDNLERLEAAQKANARDYLADAFGIENPTDQLVSAFSEFDPNNPNLQPAEFQSGFTDTELSRRGFI